MSAQVLTKQPLTSRLAELEHIVEREQRSFVEVGRALRTIRDDRLYDAAFGTFEAYCKSRFGMGRNYLNKIISATDTAEVLGTMVPITERSIRPLTKLKTKDAQRKVWKEATGRWLNPTGAQVSEVIREMFPKPAPLPKPAAPAGPSSRVVLVLDDVEEAAKVLYNCADFRKIERLHQLMGQEIEKLRVVLGVGNAA